MPALDFKEIPSAAEGAERDTFELFARDVLVFIGFEVVDGPDRGPDAGRDLIVEELRKGVGGRSRIKWLVSCKHKAHGGSAVSPTDEANVKDRLSAHDCSAFLGFYSTVPSSGLTRNLARIEHTIYDPARIEQHLLNSADGVRLARRYLPKSIDHWQSNNPEPAPLFDVSPELNCDHCGRNLLPAESNGIISVCRPTGNRERIEYIYFACKGRCDVQLSYQTQCLNMVDSWEDISDLLIPQVYLRWMMGTMNRLHGGHQYSTQAFEKLKELFIGLFPSISRHLTEKQLARICALTRIPAALGGLGD